MIDIQTRRNYVDEIEALEAKTQPLCEFDQKRLEYMKLAIIKEMDEAGDIDMTFEVFDPSGRPVVCRVTSVKFSDLDADGNFRGRKTKLRHLKQKLSHFVSLIKNVLKR